LSDEFGSKGELTVIQCDVSKDSDVDKLFCEIAKKYGGVDICINCAAIVISSNSILYGENKNWQATFDVSLSLFIIIMLLTCCPACLNGTGPLSR